MSRQIQNWSCGLEVLTKEARHVKDGHERNAARDVWQHSFCVTMNHAVDGREHPEELSVDEAFRVPLFGLRVDWGRVFDPVFDQVIRGRDNSGRHVSAHDIDLGILRVADGDVAVGIDHIVVVKYVIRRDQLAF